MAGLIDTFVRGAMLAQGTASKALQQQTLGYSLRIKGDCTQR